MTALSGYWVDLKLALRMFVKHPGLAISACLALMVGIPIGLVPLSLGSALNATPPFYDPDRLVGIEYEDISVGNQQRRILQDYDRWKGLQSFEGVAAYSFREKNLVGADGRVEEISAPSITGSAFTVLGVRALLGRTLLPSDESAGAEPVIVLEHDFWQRRFAGDAAIVGTRLQLGATTHTVVGVMPAGFKFPSRKNQAWIPLTWRAADYSLGRGPDLKIFGRLRDGVSMDQAHAEVERLRAMANVANPEFYKSLRTVVLPFTIAMTELRPTPYNLFVANLVAILLLTIACGNVGTLILARTASRSAEIAVRTALGADRRRIVMLLFLEALVLATVSAAVGLVAVDLVVRKALPPWDVPWIELGLTPRTAAFGFALAVFSAIVAGVLPALKVTGKNVRLQLQKSGTGDSGLRFGFGATALIVAQVALGVACMSVVGATALNVIRNPAESIGIAPEDFLSAELLLVKSDLMTKADSSAFADAWNAQYRRALGEAVRRLEAEPSVRGVAMGYSVPGTRHPSTRVLADSAPPPNDWEAGWIAQVALVHPGFFEGLGVSVIQGRNFDSHEYARDAADTLGARPVIVNRSFVATVLAGRSPIGRRFRAVRSPQPPSEWPEFEIIGVVDDLGMSAANPERAAGFYRPFRLGELYPVRLVVRVGSDSAFAPKLRAIFADADPELVARDVQPLALTVSAMIQEARNIAYLFASLAFAALALSVAGLYALMSYTVTVRSYEIAVRSALGAGAGHIARLVMSRAGLQLALGVVLGGIFAVWMVDANDTAATATNRGPYIIATVAIVMVVVGALACIAPTVRALRVDPARTLKTG
jgi:putative ABC transport system permease protein